MSLFVDLLTFLYDLIFGWAFDKTKDRYPILAWVWVLFCLVISLTTIILIYHYFG